MLLKELVFDVRDWNISIIGTDINAEVLKFARQGLYSKYKMRNIDLWYIQKYFDKIEENKQILYQLKKEIKDMVVFRQCNLIREPFELMDLYNVDIILCENVIIYFNQTSIQRLILNFYRILRDKGFLFLGYSETLNIYDHSFLISWWQESFAYQKDIKKKKKEIEHAAVPSCELPKKKICNPAELANIDKKTYEEIIYLLIKNCDEKNIDNCIFILKILESEEIKTDECFYIIKAEYLLERKKIIDAANACRKSLSLNPHFIDAHILLGHIYIELNMLESAEFELKTALYIDESSILSWYYYAMYCMKNRDKGKYSEFLKKAHLIYRNNNYQFKTRLYPVREEIRRVVSNTIITC
jgi:chemotaxis protein methyltransferase CheR